MLEELTRLRAIVLLIAGLRPAADTRKQVLSRAVVLSIPLVQMFGRRGETPQRDPIPNRVELAKFA